MSSLHAGEFHSSAGFSGKQLTSSNEGKLHGRRSSPSEKIPRTQHAIAGWFNAVARQERMPRTGNFSLGEICANKLRNMEMDSELGVKLHRAQRAIFVLALGVLLTALAVDAQPLSKSAPGQYAQHTAMCMSHR
jgi:hypothetical protein